MDITTLRSGQDEFLRAAEAGGLRPPEGPNAWGSDLVVAHVIAANRSFTTLTTELLMGVERSYDNAASSRREHLEAIVAGAGDWEALVTALRQSAAELVALAGRVDGATTGSPVPTLIRDGGSVVIDSVLPLEALLNGHATGHLALHTRQLA